MRARKPMVFIAIASLVLLSVSTAMLAEAHEGDATTTIDQVHNPWTTTTDQPGPRGAAEIHGHTTIGHGQITVMISNSAGTGQFCVATSTPDSRDWACSVQERPLAMGLNTLTAIATNGGTNSSARHISRVPIIIQRIAAPVDESDPPATPPTPSIPPTPPGSTTPPAPTTLPSVPPAATQPPLPAASVPRRSTVHRSPTATAPGLQLRTLALPAEPDSQNWKLTVLPANGSVRPGESVTLSGSSLPAGASVQAELHSTPVVLGTTTVAADGTFLIRATIPLDTEPGNHHYIVTVTPTNAPASTVGQAVTVVTPGSATVTSGHGTTAPREKDAPAPELDRNAPNAPSSLTTALRTAQEVFSNPVILASAAGSGAALLLLVALPAELLNTTLSEQYERIFGRLRRVRVRWLERLRRMFSNTPIVGGATLTALAALMFGFADPHFGLDLTSLRLVLACGIALFIVGHLANATTGWLVRERWQVRTVFELKPLALILTVGGVLLSRLLEFSPGFLVGLVLGIALTGKATLRQRSHTVLLRSGIILTFGTLAWAGYSILIAVVGEEPESFLEALALETLAAVAAEGMTIVLIGLLPFRFLEGEDVYKESKALWATSYFIVLLAFSVIVLPVAANWEELSGSTWLIFTIAFAALSIGTYVYFRKFASSGGDKAPEVEHEQPEDETEDSLSHRSSV